MTIAWTTNLKCVSRVQYGPSADDLPSTATSAHHGLVDANTTLHRVTVSGLKPGTTWHYRVVSIEILEFKPYKVTFGRSVQRDGQFTTLDPGKEAFSFCVVNDRHDQAAGLRQAFGSTRWEGVDLVVGLGDMINDPMSEQQVFRGFLDPCTEAFAGRIPLVLVRGNHETRGVLARDLLDYFPTSTGQYYYAFTHGGVYFLALDGGEDKADSNRAYNGLARFDAYLAEQTRWLEAQLQTPEFLKARFRVGLLHIPPAVERKGRAEFIRPGWIQKHWVPMLSRASLDLMISGHTHQYAEQPPEGDRTFPLLIGGTDTVIRVDASPERLVTTTFNDDGTVLSHPPEVRRKR